MELTHEECEELAGKIENEGFDYYFTSYGADDKLKKLCGKQIDAYCKSRQALEDALTALGVDVVI